MSNKKDLLQELHVGEKTDDTFTGTYKDAHIEIYRDDENGGDFYIQVTNKTGTYDYDGWWDDSAESSIDQAVAEAIDGAQL